MAISGRGDSPIRATFLRGASGLNRSALDALGKRSLPQANPGDLATIYGDYFFGAATPPVGGGAFCASGGAVVSGAGVAYALGWG